MNLIKMGLGCCYGIVKFFLVFCNIIFGFIGIIGTIASVWILVDPTYVVNPQESSDYIISVAIVLVASILLVLVAFLGIFGSLMESRRLLWTFLCILLILWIAEIAAGLWGYINRESLEEQIRNSVKYTVEQEYYENKDRQMIFDTFQKKLQCCGAEKPSDWSGSKQVVMSVSTDPGSYRIPESCCREGISADVCKEATFIQKSKANAIDYNFIYDKGCYTLIMDKVKEHWICALIAVLVCLGLEVGSLACAALLICGISRANRYKA